MESTVIGVYDDRTQAEGARNELIKAGFGTADVQIRDAQDMPQGQELSDEAHARADAREQVRDKWGVGGFFSSLFGSINSQDADIYHEAVRRGSYLLLALSRNDEQHAEIINIMDRYDPVDIDERSAQWRNTGWSGYDRRAPLYTDEDIQRERKVYAAQRSAAGHPLSSDVSASSSIPSSPGDRQPGRRGAKVFQRMPGSAPHDVPAPGNPIAGGTLPPDAALAPEGQGGIDVPPGPSVTTNDLDARADAAHREHWQNFYGPGGGSYDEHEPAYQYGMRLGRNERYQAYSWDQLEPDARTEWEARSPDTPWEKVKDAVRHAWERTIH